MDPIGLAALQGDKAKMNVTGSCSYEPKNCKPIN